MEVSSCAKTTRISQAITTIQTIIWSVRTGQISGLNLKLEAENFDEEWKWLGSYATWRAAMFTFMYPENLLLPTLRRRQTAGFRELVVELRRTSRLTRDDACALANQYSSYFRDVANIRIETTCEAKTQLSDVECGSDVIREGGERTLFYMFGISSVTQTGYWSSFDGESTSGYAQALWEPIPGLKENVGNIVGAVPYEVNDNNRYICLFSIISDGGDKSLVLSRYDLNSRRWLSEEEPEPLDLPDGKLFGTLVAQTYLGAPAVLINSDIDGRSLFWVRHLNGDGDDWSEEEDFTPLKPGGSGVFMSWTMTVPYALYTIDPNQILLLSSAGTTLRASVFIFKHAYLGEVQDYSGPVWEQQGSEMDIRDDTATGFYNRRWVASFPNGANSIFMVWRRGPSNEKRVRTLTVAPNDSSITLGPSSDFPSSVDLPIRTYYHESNKKIIRIVHKSFIETPGAPAVAGILMEGSTETFHGLIDLDNTGQPPSDREFATLPREFQDHDPVLFRVHDHISQEQVDLQRELFEYLRFLDVPASFFTYLHEAYYYVRIQLASQLQRNREYLAALDWYRTVYDYGAPYGIRERYRGFEYEASTSSFERLEDWLLDPLNPHLIASTRADANLRFTLMSIIRCLLEFADSEYTQDTVESVSRAVNLYETALDLLDLEALKQQLGECAELIGQLNIEIGDPADEILLFALRSGLSSIAHPEKLESLINNISKIFQSRRNTRKPIREKFAKAFALISDTRSTTSPSMGEIMGKANAGVKSLQVALLRNPKIADVTTRIGERIAADFGRQVISLYAKKNRRKLDRLPAEGINSAENSTNKLIDFAFLLDPSISGNLNDSYVPNPNFVFCIPPNPIIKILRLHAELNLYKIRNCRNIAGMERELEPYAAPTDTISGLPGFGEGAEISIPGDITIFPTPYRYAFLIERAKQFIQVTQQVENAFLSALEKRDAEAYTLLKARQDRQLARAGVRLQDLRVRVAEGEVKLAELQKDRADIQAETYQQWIDEGLIGYEQAMIGAYITAGAARMAAATINALYQLTQLSTIAATASFGAAVASGFATAG
ncbi:MAG: neuraminidase-like domain-containing protein, partial [Promethearchaeota archaeon]